LHDREDWLCGATWEMAAETCIKRERPLFTAVISLYVSEKQQQTEITKNIISTLKQLSVVKLNKLCSIYSTSETVTVKILFAL